MFWIAVSHATPTPIAWAVLHGVSHPQVQQAAALDTALLSWVFVAGMITGLFLLLLVRNLLFRWQCVCGHRHFWAHAMMNHIAQKHQLRSEH